MRFSRLPWLSVRFPVTMPLGSYDTLHPSCLQQGCQGSSLLRVVSGLAHRVARSGRMNPMYHYNPATALEELTEDATLPNPVHVRDMMLRRKLTAEQSLELNRVFLEYQKFFGEAQKLGKEILKRLAA